MVGYDNTFCVQCPGGAREAVGMNGIKLCFCPGIVNFLEAPKGALAWGRSQEAVPSSALEDPASPALQPSCSGLH